MPTYEYECAKCKRSFETELLGRPWHQRRLVRRLRRG